MAEQQQGLGSSWVPIPADSPFPLQNLPYGVFSTTGRGRRLGVAIGAHILDLRAAAEAGLLDGTGPAREAAAADLLNPLLALDRTDWRALRETIVEVLATEGAHAGRAQRRDLIVAQADAHLHLPVRITDYVDFYSGREHAETMGRMFRPDADPLLPQWRHLPMAYHGRASTVAVSGTAVRRPRGLRPGPDGGPPRYGPSRSLDYEVELGCVLGGPTPPLGESIPADRAERHIFGFVLLNDWSARDIQRYEYVPFGPFAGKSFLTSISPWVVTTDALAPWRVHRPDPDLPVADYLRSDEAWNLAVTLDTELQTARRAHAGTAPVRIGHTSAERLYWDCAQWLAHLTVSGATVTPGDLLGSGTISGWDADEKGCLAERGAIGATPLRLDDEERVFLDDGDTLRITGWCRRSAAPADPGYEIGFGEVVGTVLAAEEER